MHLPVASLHVMCHAEYDSDNWKKNERHRHHNHRQLRLLLHLVRVDRDDFGMIADLIAHLE